MRQWDLYWYSDTLKICISATYLVIFSISVQKADCVLKKMPTSILFSQFCTAWFLSIMLFYCSNYRHTRRWFSQRWLHSSSSHHIPALEQHKNIKASFFNKSFQNLRLTQYSVKTSNKKEMYSQGNVETKLQKIWQRIDINMSTLKNELVNKHATDEA